MYKRLGIECQITGDHQKISRSSKLILPGNGSFDACIKALRNEGLISLLNEKVLYERTPILGICVGAQMLGLNSEEGNEPGLGWIDMTAKRFPTSQDFRIPHMGWGAVKKTSSSTLIDKAIADDAKFYFVHSYFLDPANPNNILLTSNYGIEFPSAVFRENIFGVQFHPEKSHRFGKQFLSWFSDLSI